MPGLVNTEQIFLKFGNQDIQESSELLAQAFADDPMFRLLFDGKNGMNYRKKFFEYILNKSILLDEQFTGIVRDSKIACVASIELPARIYGIKLFLRPLFILKSIQLIFRIPFRAFNRINQYMKLTMSVRPKEPHHYLVFIGVKPEFQKMGFGKKLLEYIHEMVDSDPKSVGIGLDTENPENVSLYKHFGYELVSESRLGNLTIYSMFRSKNVSKQQTHS